MAEKRQNRRHVQHSPGRRILRVTLAVVGIIVALAILLVVDLTVSEYRPQEEEKLSVDSSGSTEALPAVQEGKDLSIVTWNIGYGALGDNADFFMDGGRSVNTADEERVRANVAGVEQELAALNPDFVFLQETDVDSARSHHINERQEIAAAFPVSTFSYNFKVKFIPYPVPPIGKVESGILTLSRYGITDSTRIQLPCPFTWPVRVANLKRCLMVDRVPVTDADGQDTRRELVLINLHLEAYDSGEGKTAQTAMLREVLQQEADKGNYVIAGGDFNQTFSGTDDSMYPEYEGRWHCGEIDEGEFPDSWQFLMDNSVPTCRSLDQSYAGKDDAGFQFYMIDGYIVSDNIAAESVRTQDLHFVNSDHNPVQMVFRLK